VEINREVHEEMKADGAKADAKCEERIGLETEHAEAGLALDAALEALERKIGVSTIEEFKLLDRAADEPWFALQRVRLRLDRHIRGHGCE
jgi:hypothetical protein